jgi:hypothetical protein
VIVPGTLFWLVKEMTVGLLPVPLVPVYAMPFPLKVIETALAPSCANVIGEPVGVQRLPIVFEEQPASVPKPAFSVFRSILMRPDAVPENSAQSAIFGVKVGAPARLP